MHKHLAQTQNISLLEDVKTLKRLEFSLKKSKELDQTIHMDEASKLFSLESCRDRMWNPEHFSLLWGTWLWDQACPSQRILLNQLYWVAYYSQITSAEIATIFFNQTSAAALYGCEDFRIVCDTLDLESAQERAHINAFKTVSEDFEYQMFGRRVFTYPMRSPFVKTMMHSDLGLLRQELRKWQLRIYSVISANSPFIGCQYFTVRGLRTLNGKIVQHQLSKYFSNMNVQDAKLAPIPSKISYYHFLDESFHFNTSTVISHEVINSLKPPTKFESWVSNTGLWGCQKDHFNFSTAINGIFWFDPSLYSSIYLILRSPHFGMDHRGALEAIEKSFCEDSQGSQVAAATHRQSIESYKAYLADFNYIKDFNKEMHLMSRNNLQRHLRTNLNAFKKFARAQKDEILATALPRSTKSSPQELLNRDLPNFI